MASTELNDHITHLDIFPTRIFKIRIKQDLIEKSIESISQYNNSEGWSYTDIINDPNFKKLHQTVLNKATNIFPESLSIDQWKISAAWFNVQSEKADQIGFHSHFDSFMSAALYLAGKEMFITFRDNPKEAQANVNSICDYSLAIKHSFHQDISIAVQPGDLIIFPSYLIHKANTNNHSSKRMSIAYNFLPNKKDSPNRHPWNLKEFQLIQ